MLGLSVSISKAAASMKSYVKDNLKLYLDFKSNKSDTLKFPCEGSTAFVTGSSQYIDIGVQSSLQFASGTYAVWIYPTGNGVIYSRYVGPSYDIRWEVSGTTILCAINSINRVTTPADSITLNAWNHVAISISSSSILTYVNGSLIDTDSGLAIDTNAVANKIGYGDFGTYFGGKMANLGAWSRILSPEEIQSIMNKSYSQLKGVEKTSLVSWWGLDQNEITALNFDGSNDKAENTSFTTHQSDTGTLSTWIIPNALGTNQRFIGVGGNSSTGTLRSLEIQGSGALRFVGYGADWVVTGVTLAVGQLYHLAVSWNGDDIVVYVNGVGYSQTLASLTTPTGTKFKIGEEVWSTGDDANIKCISASFYTTTLLLSEIQSIYNNGYQVSEVGNSNIAHYWKMDNSSTVTDLVGSKNLTVTGATLVTNARQSDSKSTNHGVTIGAITTTSVYGGNAPILPRAVDVAKEGQADAIGNGSASFTASNNDYIVTASNIDLDGGKSRTFSAWIRPDDNPSSGNIYDVLSYGAGTNGNYFEFGIYNDSGTIKAWANLHGEDTMVAQTFTVGEWYHYAIVYTAINTTTGTLKLYINGILVNTSGTLGSSNAINTTNDQLDIGRRNSGSGYFDGDIAQLGAWAGALTQAQIQSVMESTSYDKIPASVKSTLGSSEITSASNTTFSGVTSNDWSVPADVTKSFSNNQMVFTMDDDAPAGYVAQFSSGNFVGSSGIPQKFLKVTIDIDSTTTGSYSINNAGGSCSANVFLKNPLTTGVNTIYGVCNGASSYFRIFEVDVSTGDKLVINSFDVQEVTNDIVAFYPLDADNSANGVTNDATTGEVLGSELISNGSFDTDTTGWIKNNGSMDVINGELKVITSSSYWEGVRYNFGTSVSGGIYKAVFTARLESGNSPQIQFSSPSGSSTYSNATSISGSSNVTYTFYFIANANNSNTYLTFFNGSAASSTFYLDNVSLKKVTSNTGVLK